MKVMVVARRVIATLAIASMFGAIAAGEAAAETNQVHGLAGAAERATSWQFEFTAKWTVTLSCYFENLDRTDATGPKKYTGTGKTKDLAEKDAWNKAQADAPQGRKVKHCRTESSSKK
ncbi:hypothetical protein ACWEVD_18770 [Nocardia thailandica]